MIWIGLLPREPSLKPVTSFISLEDCSFRFKLLNEIKNEYQEDYILEYLKYSTAHVVVNEDITEYQWS